MNFIKYDKLVFSKLSLLETVLITAEKPTWVECISVCNLSDDNTGIRVNLKIIKLLDLMKPKEAFKIKNLLIIKNQTKNLVSYLENKIFLNNGDSLLISSNGYKELFDCVVDFYELNEDVS